MPAPMAAAAGIVNSHAQTIWPATPHRTADKRLVAPTPTIGPGDRVRRADRDAEVGGEQDRRGRAGLGGEPVHRLQLRDPRSHRVDDPPPARQRAEPDGGVSREHHPERHVERPLQVARREQHAGDDPHRLLRVVRAVVQAEQRRRHELQAAEPLVHARRESHARRSSRSPPSGSGRPRGRSSATRR